jgi:murein DD-endopeptidase MepM/ murein hydrolase activator NlpD
MRPAEPVRSPSVFRLAVCASLAMATAACSSDTNRLEQPFSNPFASNRQAEATGSVPAQQRPGYVESRPLPPQGQYSQAPYPAPQYQPPQQPYSQPQYSQPLPPPPRVSQPAVRPAAYNPPRQDVTGSVAQQKWGWDGGTPVTVAQGETIQSLSHRYGVPALAIAEANGMSTATPIYPGQRLVIPKYSRGQAAVPPPPAQPQLASAPIITGSVRNASQGGVHTVAPGETLFSVARRYHVSPVALAQANNLPPHHQLRMGERLTIPGAAGSRIAQAAPRPAPAIAAPPQRPVVQAPPPAGPRVAEFQPAPPPAARVMTPAKENPAAEEAKPEPAEASAGNGPGFRWPARGRVITGFGPKPTGQQNDGINIAVPEGTPVKASDDGVVAYAGNELKGYGNLVLVRHSNGYVTAYAHASELMVKRGDSVKRGQVIAKSGQTGNVSSPQLHFEVRKGATPVDPMQHLAGAI